MQFGLGAARADHDQRPEVRVAPRPDQHLDRVRPNVLLLDHVLARPQPGRHLIERGPAVRRQWTVRPELRRPRSCAPANPPSARTARSASADSPTVPRGNRIPYPANSSRVAQYPSGTTLDRPDVGRAAVPARPPSRPRPGRAARTAPARCGRTPARRPTTGRARSRPPGAMVCTSTGLSRGHGAEPPRDPRLLVGERRNVHNVPSEVAGQHGRVDLAQCGFHRGGVAGQIVFARAGQVDRVGASRHRAGSIATSLSTTSSDNGGTARPSACAVSAAIPHWPPLSPTMATRRPRGGRVANSARATSISSAGVPTRATPRARQAASTTSSGEVSDPVCERASRGARRARPDGEQQRRLAHRAKRVEQGSSVSEVLQVDARRPGSTSWSARSASSSFAVTSRGVADRHEARDPEPVPRAEHGQFRAELPALRHHGQRARFELAPGQSQVGRGIHDAEAVRADQPCPARRGSARPTRPRRRHRP